MESSIEQSFGIIPIKRISGLPTDPLTLENTRVLLILQKTISPQYPHFWCCPKGHAESTDAGPLDTAIRELLEETSLVVKPEGVLLYAGPYQESYVNPTMKGKKTVTYFSGIVVINDEDDFELQEQEVESAAWLSWNEAIEKATFDNTKNILRRAMIDIFKVRAETTGIEIKDRSFGIIPIAVQSRTSSEHTKISSQNTKVLLIQQKTFDENLREKLQWALPKGHAEISDKSPIASAIRELMEETGLAASFVWENPGFSMVYWTSFKQCWKKVEFYIGLVDENQKIKCEEREVNDAQFVNFQQALELVSSEHLRNLLAQVIEKLDSDGPGLLLQ